MISCHQSLVFFFFFELAFFCVSTRASNCIQTCGSTTASYPFGFSDGCPIRLNCSAAGEMQLSGYRIRNITSGNIVLDVPPVCNRSIDYAKGFFGPHYAMTSRNALFRRNCSRTRTDRCSFSTDIVSRFLNLTDCGQQGDDISCYPTETAVGFLSQENFKNATAGCEFLFSSAIYGEDASKQAVIVVGAADLEWWLDGKCGCAANAGCTHVDPPDSGRAGFRCSCLEGFTGDGFANGTGCVRADGCSGSSSSSGSCRGGSKIGVIVGGIAAGASLVLGLAFLCHRIGRRYTISEGEETIHRLLSQTSSTVTVYSYKDVERATGNFSDASKLGSGAYATVHVGKFSNSGPVAVKRLKHPDTDNVEHVINEIKLVSSISHPNLVHLLGCCIESRQHILVYEFMPNGTLSQHLRRERGEGLSWPARVSIATETAKAIAYLHTAVYPPIYHRDIKSSNILLDYNLRPKLADFGLSRTGMVELSHISTAPQGTPGYVDPQYHQNFHLSDKSDVYSFGVVLVEIITAMKVVDFRRAPNEVNLASLAIDKIGKGLVEDIVDPFIKESWDGRTEASVKKVVELAFRCLAFHTEVRPSMTEVAEELERIGIEECYFAQHEGLDDEQQDESKSKRLEMESKVAEVASPVSVQDQWAIEQSYSSSNGSWIHLNH